MNRQIEMYYPYLSGIFLFVFLIFSECNVGWGLKTFITLQCKVLTLSPKSIPLINVIFLFSLFVPLIVLIIKSIMISNRNSLFIKHLKEANAYRCFNNYFTEAIINSFILSFLSVMLIIFCSYQILLNSTILSYFCIFLYFGILMVVIACTFRILSIFRQYSIYSN